MFLLDELAGPLERSSAGTGQTLRRIPEKPEPAALAPIERYSKLFLKNTTGYSFRHMYGSHLSSTASDEIRRALGAATLQERHHAELLDGISRNMLTHCLENYSRSYSPITFSLLSSKRNLLGARIRQGPIPIDHMLGIVSKSFEWDDLPETADGSQRLIDFSVRIYEKPMVLRFTGELEGGRDKAREFGAEPIPVGSISKIELLGRSSHFLIPELRSRIAEVVPDFRNRTNLADDYAKAPTAIGMPAELRAEIKRKLQSAEIEPESYSRVGFSSGSFPGAETKLRVAGTEMKLRFERCSHCGDVEALSIEGPETAAQFAAARLLTIESIAPWHRSICSVRPEAQPTPPVQPLAVSFRAPSA